MTNFRRIQKQRQGEKSIHHFSHKHELFFYYYGSVFSHPSCVVCDSTISTDEEYLSCGSSCTFHMHKSCAELPQKLKHPFHPQHSLTLLDEAPPSNSESKCYCRACGELCTNDFLYECSECEFYIDTKCVMLFPTTRLPAKHQKLRHPHPLFVCERKIVEPHMLDHFTCGGCFASFDDDDDEREMNIDYSTLIYVCLECHVLLHQSCADLPQNITHHPLHPDCSTLAFHTSTYNYSDRIICDFCQYDCRRFYFQCSDCSIKMDIRCALLTPCTTSNFEPVVEEAEIGHGHPHPLIHCNIHVNHYGWKNCSGCEQPLEKSVYYCISCKLWLHESCAHLPHQIQHPFHPHHPLTLSDSTDHFRGKEFTCNSYRYKSKRFAYLCHPCKFYLHVRCSSPPLYPMIYMPKLHQHPLAFSDIIFGTSCPNCDSYNEGPPYDDRPAFRCMQCEFDIHISCFPLLPPTVKAPCHRHPLTLTREPIGDPDGSVNYNNEDYYCDICEDQRSLISILKDPSYYCAECHLVSHVHCVISEVMNYLQEKSTWVEELVGDTKLLVFDDTISDADMKDEDFDNLLSGVGKEIETVNTKLKQHREECAELSAKLKQEEEIRSQVSRKLRDLKGKRRQLIKERRDHIFHLKIQLWSKDQ